MFDENFWRNAPKTYCDNANMALVGGLGNVFMLGLLSGGNAQVFTFTPEHMKRFAQLINHNIQSYEATHGAIRAEDWTPEMKSPLQAKDLEGGSGADPKK